MNRYHSSFSLPICIYCILFFLWTFLSLSGCEFEKPGNHHIYVTVAGDNEIVVIDERREAIISHIPVGAGPSIILATPDESKLYTANWGDNTVSAVDVQSEEVTSIAMSGRPYIIAMSPNGRFVYAGLYSNEIAVISTHCNQVVRSFQTPELPASLFVSPDGKILYIAIVDAVPGTIRAISTITGEVIHEPINVGIGPGWITMSPDGAKVYALNYYSDDVSVVDTSKWVVEAAVSTGEGGKAIIGNVSPDNQTLYVTNAGTANLMSIDTKTNQVTGTIDMTGRPVGVCLNADGSSVYVTDYGPESIGSSEASSFLETGVYTPTYGGQVSIIDTETKELAAKIDVGPGPTSVVVLTARGR